MVLFTFYYNNRKLLGITQFLLNVIIIICCVIALRVGNLYLTEILSWQHHQNENQRRLPIKMVYNQGNAELSSNF